MPRISEKVLCQVAEAEVWEKGPGADCPACRMPARLAVPVTPFRRAGYSDAAGATHWTFWQDFRCHWCDGVWRVNVDIPDEALNEFPGA